MSETAIEWTQRTWNPIVGCSLASPGCTNCYAMTMAYRLERMGVAHYAGLTRKTKAGPVWTGKLAQAPEHVLTEPLRRRKPTTWFVNSMGDLFHEDVPDEWIDRVFAVMALSPQHTFQVLTKRAARMRAYVADPTTPRRIYELACDMTIELQLGVVLIAPGAEESFAPAGPRIYLERWPLANVWKGVSAEDQERANERVPKLLDTAAAVRFVSGEPLLGPIAFGDWLVRGDHGLREIDPLAAALVAMGEADGSTWVRPALDWIIVGGESGPKARPMHPDWARQIRDHCAAAGTAFFFKQWGEWRPDDVRGVGVDHMRFMRDDGLVHAWGQGLPFETPTSERERWRAIALVGKKRAGRELDGIEHNAMPQVRHV